jgi:DNA repair photolyase
MKACTSKKLQMFDQQQLLGESKVEYATWAVNHVRGCNHGCLYCYGMKGERQHGKIETYDDWCRATLARDAVEQVRGELSRKRLPVDRVHLCFMGDPFVWDAEIGRPIDEVAAVTLDLMKVINGTGVPVTVLTKGLYPDLDLSALHPDNQYGITAVSLNEAFRHEWEPGAPPVAQRIAHLKMLSDAGARTWVSVEPYPTPNLDPSAENVGPLLEALAFVDKVIFGRLNYVPEVTEYLGTVDRAFYDRVAHDVTAWCAAKAKPLHIKKGTPLHSPSTVSILAMPAVENDRSSASGESSPPGGVDSP